MKIKQSELYFYEMLRDFLYKYLVVRRKFSKATVNNYTVSLDQYRRYLKEQKGISFDQFQNGHLAALNIDAIHHIPLKLANLFPQGQVFLFASRELVGGFQSPGIQKVGFMENVVVFIDISSIGLLTFSIPQNSFFAVSTLLTHFIVSFQ